MGEILLFTGGARSGKSTMAEAAVKAAAERAASSQTDLRTAGGDGGKVLYIATAAVCDEEMAERVRKHREQRPADWETLEQFWNFDSLADVPSFQSADAVLLDCMGFMLNNIMYYSGIDWETLPLSDMQRVEQRMIDEIHHLMRAAREADKTLALVTNEVGMGLVPAERSSRYYRDILGRANRTVAQEADRVCFLVSGIPMWIKGDPTGGSGCHGKGDER